MYIPRPRSLKAYISTWVKNRLNGTEAETQPCFTPLEILNLSEDSPSESTAHIMSLWNSCMSVVSFKGQPNFLRMVHSVFLLTMSNVFIRAMNTEWRFTFCSGHFSWTCLTVRIMSMVLQSGWNPQWVMASQRSGGISCSSQILAKSFMECLEWLLTQGPVQFCRYSFIARSLATVHLLNGISDFIHR